MKVKIKVCGISNEKSAKAAKDADFIGFVFYQKSPRFIDALRAREISNVLQDKQKKVGLFVNADMKVIQHITEYVELDMIQLHGKECIKEIIEIKQRLNIPVIKAISVSNADDIRFSRKFEKCCDMILFDSKAKINDLPGGSGKSFDWNLLANFKSDISWMLAGGLNIKNVKNAITETNASIIDVSSGVEKKRGVKCEKKIKEFIEYVKKN
ncbi:MAG: phosphoribosylanthranilate isomerase [Rickettsiales bacterium]|nr:phosphoribosylanthranilate isomerase [Rickettsiales bacterium]